MVPKLGAILGYRHLCNRIRSDYAAAVCLPLLGKIPVVHQSLQRSGLTYERQVGLAEGTFYPAVHTVLGGWYTKQGKKFFGP